MICSYAVVLLSAHRASCPPTFLHGDDQSINMTSQEKKFTIGQKVIVVATIREQTTVCYNITFCIITK